MAAVAAWLPTPTELAAYGSCTPGVPLTIEEALTIQELAEHFAFVDAQREHPEELAARW